MHKQQHNHDGTSAAWPNLLRHRLYDDLDRMINELSSTTTLAKLLRPWIRRFCNAYLCFVVSNKPQIR